MEARLVDPASRRPHFAALDGLRGLAILMVLFVHFIGDAAPHTWIERAMVKLANYGVWGVDLFFVLSGFLITGILFDAKASPHYFRDFYARRTLRIFPLYFGILLVLFGVLPIVLSPYPHGLAETARHQGWLWTYACNLYLARAGSWALPYASHFWSLSVEEHFYLIWPIVVLVCERTTLLRVCALVAASALGLRCTLAFAGASDVTLVVLTPCRLDALCVGAFLALWVREKGLEHAARVARRSVGALAGLVLAASAWHLATNGLLRELVLPVRGSLVALFFGALLVASLGASRTSPMGSFFQSRAMRFLGKYSYGLYVYHGVIAFALQERGSLDALAEKLHSHLLAMLVQAILGAAASLLVAVASYELFEKQFLRLKDRLAPPEHPADARPVRHTPSTA